MNWLINKILEWRGVPMEHTLLERMSKEQREKFSNEATFIKDTQFFSWFIEDLELAAERYMFKGNKEALLFGKGMLYCIELMDRNVKAMSKGATIDDKNKREMRRFS